MDRQTQLGYLLAKRRNLYLELDKTQFPWSVYTEIEMINHNISEILNAQKGG